MTGFRGGRQPVTKKDFFGVGKREGRILAGVPFLLYRPRTTKYPVGVAKLQKPF